MLGPTLPLVLVALPVVVAACVVLCGLLSRLQGAPEPIPAARVVMARKPAPRPRAATETAAATDDLIGALQAIPTPMPVRQTERTRPERRFAHGSRPPCPPSQFVRTVPRHRFELPVDDDAETIVQAQTHN